MSINKFEQVSITVTSPKDIVYCPIEKLDWEDLYAKIESRSKVKTIAHFIISIISPSFIGYGLSLLVNSNYLWALICMVIGVIAVAITKSLETIKFASIRDKATYIQNKMSKIYEQNIT